MNRVRAKQLSETISDSDIKEMLENAQKSMLPWNAPSAANKNISNGKAMEIFTGYVVRNPDRIDDLAKVNMIHCFGDYLPLKMEDVVELEDWEIDMPFGEWLEQNSKNADIKFNQSKS